MAEGGKEITVDLKARVDLREVLEAVGLLEMIGRLERALEKADNPLVIGYERSTADPEQQLICEAWIATAEMLSKQWKQEIEAHEQTKQELTARIVELQAALAMQAGE